MSDVVSFPKSKPRKFTSAEALDWLKGQPGQCTDLGPTELGKRWGGWHHTAVTRQLGKWIAAGDVHKKGKLICAGPEVPPHTAHSGRTSTYGPVSAEVATMSLGPASPHPAALAVGGGFLVLLGSGFGLIALTTNVSFAASFLGWTPAGVGTGVGIDLLEVTGISLGQLLRGVGLRGPSRAMQAVWAVALGVTFVAGTGSISSQLGDADARAGRAIASYQDTTQQIEWLEGQRRSIGAVTRPTDAQVDLAKGAVASAKQAEGAECRRVGDNCRRRASERAQRETELGQLLARQRAADSLGEIEAKLAQLRATRDAAPVVAEADPVNGFVRGVARRLSLHVTDREVRYGRAAVLSAFQLLGGLLFGFGTALWGRIPRDR